MARSIVTLDNLTPNNLGTFKVINEVCLPVSYTESWYTDLLNLDQLKKLAFFSELPVGAVKGKLINLNHKTPTFEVSTSGQINSKIVPNAVYIESLAVLPAYRGHGVASLLLDWLIAETKERFVHEIALHVHIDNTESLEWYKKKGFVQQGEVVKDYYKQQGLANPDAYVLTLSV